MPQATCTMKSLKLNLISFQNQTGAAAGSTCTMTSLKLNLISHLQSTNLESKSATGHCTKVKDHLYVSCFYIITIYSMNSQT